MSKFYLNRPLKVGLILACVILLGAVLLFGIAVFRIGSALTSLSENVEVTHAIPKTSPFKKPYRQATKNIAINDSSKNMELRKKTPSQSSKLFISERINFSLEGFNTVLNSEFSPVRLCDIQCDDLRKVIARIEMYSKGNLKSTDDYLNDPAFHLSALMNQAGLGPPGKAVLLVIYQLQKDPSLLSSVIEVTKLLSHVDEIVKAIDARKNTRIIEADDLMNVLRDEANSCHAREWKRTCSSLETEIETWKLGGALQ